MVYVDDETVLLEIKPITQPGFLKNNSNLKAFKGVINFIFAIFLSVFILMGSEFFSIFISLFIGKRTFTGFNFVTMICIFIGLLIILPSVFDFLLLNYLKNTVYKVYKSKIVFKSNYIFYLETELPMERIAEISGWQAPEEKNTDTGCIFLSAAQSNGGALLFIPDYSTVMELIRELSKK